MHSTRFIIQSYGDMHVIKEHSDNKSGNLLPVLQWLLFMIMIFKEQRRTRYGISEAGLIIHNTLVVWRDNKRNVLVHIKDASLIRRSTGSLYVANGFLALSDR